MLFPPDLSYYNSGTDNVIITGSPSHLAICRKKAASGKLLHSSSHMSNTRPCHVALRATTSGCHFALLLLLSLVNTGAFCFYK